MYKMKKTVTKEELSRYRQRIHQLTEKLKILAMKAGYPDEIFAGVPCEVYRTCGKATCRCMNGGERHGPYKVVQVWRDNRSRQVTLKKGEEIYFEKAQHYQTQQKNRQEVEAIGEEVVAAVDAMLERRTIWQKE